MTKGKQESGRGGMIRVWTPVGPLYKFVEFPPFPRHWAGLGLDSVDDMAALQNAILKNPEAAPVIPGTNGMRKLRFPLPGTGKRGGARVWYAVWPEFGAVTLHAAYAKSAKENPTPDQARAYARAMEVAGGWLAKRL